LLHPYQGIAHTIVQLFRPQASGVIASSQPIRAGHALMNARRILRRETRAMKVQEATLERRKVTRPSVTQSASTDERLLIKLAKSGRSVAFGDLYERHRWMVYHTAFRILRNRQDAEDAVQRSFQSAFVSLDRFREDSAFSTWVTRIAINEALMLLRRRRADTSLPENNIDDPEVLYGLNLVDKGPSPEQALADNELRAVVTHSISHLRESLRKVVLLRELQGLTSSETARRLGLTVSAVKARTFHARRYLRRYLQQKYKLRTATA
jgi:RNA polymerase sigma-70 factor (ECF subfamily)